MFESIILGMVQGIFEWLPVSSEGLILLIKANVFPDGSGLESNIQTALFLHLGTVLAALIYLRKDVKILFHSIFRYQSATKETRQTLWFLVSATSLSMGFGFIFMKGFIILAHQPVLSAKFINLAVGICLLGTAFMGHRAKKGGYRQRKDLELKDGLWLGLVQGFAAFPGLSRSGITVAALLFRQFNEAEALRLSFLMSIPIVLAGNIYLIGFQGFQFSKEAFTELGVSFAFGLLTIHMLLKLAQRINFSKFVFLFGILTILAALIL